MPPRRSSPKWKAEDRYEQLVVQFEPALKDPQQRLTLAEEVFSLSKDGQTSQQFRLDVLQQAVRLDPFSMRYRLELAETKHKAGLLEEAIAEYRRALELWPNSPKANLLLGMTLLDAGQAKQAEELLKKVSGDGELGEWAAYGLIECQLRQAQALDDWKDVITALRKLEVSQHQAGVFCEKCLKIIIDCDQKEIVQDVVSLAEKKVGQAHRSHGAYQLLQRMARWTPDATANSANAGNGKRERLEGLLQAYLLAREFPLGKKDLETELDNLHRWRELVEHQIDNWPALQAAYLQVLDEWASRAYRKKSFTLAGALWQEAERLSPYNPAVLQNLAIVHTRLKDEGGYQWYWDRVTQSWILHSEMMPQADGYTQSMLQKHQAFMEGAQTKLSTLQTPQELLELAALWIKEVIPFCALKQLAFRNSYFRCGVIADDWTTEEEQQEALETGYNSVKRWLALAADWQGWGERATLAEWRQERLALAWQATTDSDVDRYRFYDEEKEAFRQHREYLLNQYLMLLFRVMMPVAEKLDLEDEEARRRYALVGQGLLSFPHHLLKPGVLKIVEQLDPETDLYLLVQNYAVAPWFRRAQQLLQEEEAPGRAAVFLEEMLAIAPDFALGMFYLAQCRAAEERFEDAYQLLAEARKHCKEGDELQGHLEKFAAQMDIARVNKRLEKAQELLKQEDGAGAVRECKAALRDYPDHPYVMFILAQAYISELEIEEAKSALRQAKDASLDKSDLIEVIEKNLKELEEYGPQIILSKAVPRMQAEQWQEAQKLLAKGQTLKPQDAHVTFYEAICWARMSNGNKAKQLAQKALPLCRHTDDELKAEIQAFLKQIPMIPIAKDFEKAQQAMNSKRWREALSHLNAAASKSPNVVIVQFYKALCHFNLEEWAEAERTAQKTLPLCGKDDKNAKEQLELMLEQIPLARVAKDMEKAQKAIERERWQEASGYLDIVLSKSPDHVVALFYQALCHFRLKNFDKAEGIARRAQRLCGSEHKQVREQLDTMLSQMDSAREAAALEPVTQAVEQQNWHVGLKETENYLLWHNATSPVALFYKALCEWNLDRKKDAKQTARNALPYARGTEYEHIRNQLNQIIQAADVPAWAGDMNRAVQAMNAEKWGDAVGHLKKVLNMDSTNAQAYYYRALCNHQFMMAAISKGSGVTPDAVGGLITWFEGVLGDLDEAERHRSYSERELGSGISSLRSAAESALSQLRSLRRY